MKRAPEKQLAQTYKRGDIIRQAEGSDAGRWFLVIGHGLATHEALLVPVSFNPTAMFEKIAHIELDAPKKTIDRHVATDHQFY